MLLFGTGVSQVMESRLGTALRALFNLRCWRVAHSFHHVKGKIKKVPP